MIVQLLIEYYLVVILSDYFSPSPLLYPLSLSILSSLSPLPFTLLSPLYHLSCFIDSFMQYASYESPISNTTESTPSFENTQEMVQTCKQNYFIINIIIITFMPVIIRISYCHYRTPKFISFIDQCLTKDHTKRPTSDELLRVSNQYYFSLSSLTLSYPLSPPSLSPSLPPILSSHPPSSLSLLSPSLFILLGHFQTQRGTYSDYCYMYM